MSKTTTLLAIMLGATLTITLMTLLTGTTQTHAAPAITLAAISTALLAWSINNDKKEGNK